MKLVTVIGIFLFFLSSCDTIPIRYTPFMCLKHRWSDTVYRVDKMDGLKVFLKSVPGSEEKEISKLDRGWNEVSCP